VVAAETRRNEAQAALERVTERRIDVDRPHPITTARLPVPDPPAPTPPPGGEPVVPTPTPSPTAPPGVAP
jgi:hypothetical protein